MKTIINKIGISIFTIVLTFSMINCKAVDNANNKQKGAVIGAAGGAVLGAIIGNNVGKVATENLVLSLEALLAELLVY